MNLEEIPIIVIAGPTGVGKTELSILLAQHFNGEIINGDSLQVYKHLNIGTGKITPEEMDGIPHHLLDILEVHEDYDASRFKEDAQNKIIDIYKRGKLPMVVGGTGLYLEGLLYDLEFGRQNSRDDEIRNDLINREQEIGSLALWEELNVLDSAAAEKIPHQNSRRTIRALEVIKVTGQKFSAQQKHTLQPSVFNECLIILNRDRQLLYSRINRRVELMIQEGLEQEARHLYEWSNQEEWQSIKGIGYKEWWPYFQERLEKEEVVAQIQQNSRRYAKRQLTWFRNRMKDTHWIDMGESERAKETAVNLIERHLNN